MKNSLLLLLTLTVRLAAQRPDLDDLSRGVDLSTLKPIDTPSPAGEPDTRPPHTHLFVDMDLLTPLPEPGENQFHPIPNSDVQILELPAAEYLIIPNPPRIDAAYRRLAATLAEWGTPAGFPLKVVLHADSKFSVAIALKQTNTQPLPIGVDISPLPSITLLGVVADIQLLQKDHPPVLEAFQAIRTYASSAELEIDTNEFYALPREPGQVFFAVRVTSGPIQH